MTLELMCVGMINKKEGTYEIKIAKPYQLRIVEESDSKKNYETGERKW